METKSHWRTVFAFLVIPIIFLGVFGVSYYKALNMTEPIPTELFIVLSFFGVLGFWLLLTLILRAKKITINKNGIIITRIFIFKQFAYSPNEILSYSIGERKEDSTHVNNNYKILQFTTSDSKTHSIISYEFKEFDEILRWISETQAEKVIFRAKSFVQHEYGLPFLIGLLTTIILIILLTI